MPASIRFQTLIKTMKPALRKNDEQARSSLTLSCTKSQSVETGSFCTFSISLMKVVLMPLHRSLPYLSALAAMLATSFTYAAGKACDVRAMGAAGDGRTKDTAAIQSAIDACSVPHGGIVHFAAGTYVSGPLDWKSHVRLQLDSGATLLGSPDRSDYPIREDAKWRRVSLLHADHATDTGCIGKRCSQHCGKRGKIRQRAMQGHEDNFHK
jgi:hypothetical protein